MPRRAKTWIHVNQHVIKANRKNNTNNPAITVKRGKTNTYCHRVKINGPSEIISSDCAKPILSCGARVAIMTYAEVETL